MASYDLFTFEYKNLVPQAGSQTSTQVEKVSTFLCRENVSQFLGLTQYANLAGASTKQIATYQRTVEQMGGAAGGGAGTATTITVDAHSRVSSSRSAPQGSKVAIIKARAVNPSSQGKNRGKNHNTGSFNFPSSTSVQEIIIALSMLFAKNTAILGTGTDTGLIYPKLQIKGGKAYPFITNATALTELEGKYGVRVATTTAEAQALGSAAAVTG